MAAMAEKVNKVSRMIAEITPDPAERFAIACVLTEMYRYEVTKAFEPMAAQKEPTP